MRKAVIENLRKGVHRMKKDKKMLIEILKCVRLFAIMILAAGICLFIYDRYHQTSEPEVTSSFINGKLEAASDLTASRLVYTGLIKYSEGSIPFLTQNSFSMIYTASVRAGIDLSKAQVRLTDDKAVITLPECVVQSIEVDPDSIEFYDEHWALFNWTQKADVIDTISAAKADVSQKADMESLLQNARLQTEKIIEGLLEDAVGDRKLIIQ